MSITPVRCMVDVKVPPARAFDLFTTRMGAWWPVSKTPAKQPHVAIVVEPRAEGRWFERDASGTETRWGKVLVWDPPSRLVLGWQFSTRFVYDPDFLNEVEITFTPLATGGTRVSLEHRDLERYGADAETMAGKIAEGWPLRLGEFAAAARA